MSGAVRDVGCRAAGFPNHGRRARGSRPRRRACFGISFFSRRWGGVGGSTHRDEGPSQGLVGLLLLDRLGGEENFAVERAAAARVLGARPSLPLPASEARGPFSTSDPGTEERLWSRARRGRTSARSPLRAFAPTVRAVISGCAVSLSHHRGSRRTSRGARGGLTRSHRRAGYRKESSRVQSRLVQRGSSRNAFFGHGFPVWRWKKNPTRSRGKSRLIRQCEVGGCSTGDALLRVVDARRNAAPLACARSRTNEDGGNLVRAWSAGAEDASRARRHRETHVASIAW